MTPERRKILNGTATLAAGLALGVGGTLGVQAINQSHEPTTIKPGGVWESPVDHSKVGGTIHFAAKAYPTKPEDPPIDHVNFTAELKGVWQVACKVTPPKQGSEYTCDWHIPEQFKEANQIVIVSFDVYDQQGHVNKAPNGERTLVETQ